MANNIMHSKILSIGDFFKDREIKYVIPNFQRPFSWEIENINTLLEDLDVFFEQVEMQKNNSKKIDNYYAGTFYTYQSAEDIDVKQNNWWPTKNSFLLFIFFINF